MRDEISTSILDKFIRISEDNDASLKEDRVPDFIWFILENEDSHKYVDPNIEKILIPKSCNCENLAFFKILKYSHLFLVAISAKYHFVNRTTLIAD